MDKKRLKIDDDKPISVHRAFLYSALGPGWGEVYSGFRMQGYITASVFAFFLIWFNWIIIDIFIDIYRNLFGSLNGHHYEDLKIPYYALGISIIGAFYAWSWGIISAVNVSRIRRNQDQITPQKNEFWAMAISWVCPGAGQVYAGKKQIGLIMFVFYLLGIIFLIPVYTRLGNGVLDVAISGQFSPYDPFALVNAVKKIVTRMEYSIENQIQILVKYLAFAGTIIALQGKSTQKDPGNIEHPPPVPVPSGDHSNWINRSGGYIIALLFVGWICPGAGQFLQKRQLIGWIFFSAYFGTMILIGSYLSFNKITPEFIIKFNWLFALMKLIAAVEAPLHMKGNKMMSLE